MRGALSNGHCQVQILLEGDPDKFKYHMMNWDNVCVPKEFGGLGITNTRF
jgi:hypothetical protein